ncbi:MAG: hypothetical protein JOZ62_06270 [Acidobacteriaceae bacterium]|nr:hypothetical protein [Acidobacteriaceae bacterium]
MYRTLFIGICVAVLPAVTVDRIAITVGRDVITELQLDEELRITAFVNRQPIVRNLQARRAAGARLIEQLLVKREMELSHYPSPTGDEIEQYESQIKAGFGSAERFAQAIRDYGLSENIIKDHLALQLMTLRFIEFRFKPDVAGPALADMDAQTDEALNAWLAQTRKQVTIVYLDKLLQ